VKRDFAMTRISDDEKKMVMSLLSLSTRDRDDENRVGGIKVELHEKSDLISRINLYLRNFLVRNFSPVWLTRRSYGGSNDATKVDQSYLLKLYNVLCIEQTKKANCEDMRSLIYNTVLKKIFVDICSDNEELNVDNEMKKIKGTQWGLECTLSLSLSHSLTHTHTHTHTHTYIQVL